jgi:hypothetical protein
MAYFCPTNPSYRDYARYGVVEMCEGPRRGDFLLGACEGDEVYIVQKYLRHAHDVGMVEVLREVYDHRSKEVAAFLWDNGERGFYINWTLSGEANPQNAFEWHIMLQSACEMGRRQDVNYIISGNVLAMSTIRRARATAAEYGHVDIVRDITAYVDREGLAAEGGVYIYSFRDEHLTNKLHLEDMQYALYSACLKGQHDIVEALLPLAADEVLQTTMRWACEGGHAPIIRKLILSGVLVRDTHIQNACRLGHSDAAEVLLNHDPQLASAGLWGACKGGYQHLIDKMIAAGAVFANCINCWGRFH